jgi:hypothetical protein
MAELNQPTSAILMALRLVATIISGPIFRSRHEPTME